jgi:hypothetical protein
VNPYQPPAAAMSWPGICQHLEITGHPRAGEVTLDNGTPVARLSLGRDLAGHDVTLEITSLAGLGELSREIQLEQARLAMWYPREAHPFDGAA